ncbi:DGQHR domain-containing protein [Geobacter pelophilus]|uniref:DGQHR domain-containing protein n=2 Tax=Geoanaerobacter pelophilus TaxID=60036 RepID=A0AAW4L3W0_9BACT|nr:DGQHR domain-containing protein [Geoanaerobacter pelophilus]
MKKNTATTIPGIVGVAGGLEVFLGFATASFLCKNSFSDILNEDTGEGYQRPYNRNHSLDFRNYILRHASSTPPLIFNLRNELCRSWSIQKGSGNSAFLTLEDGVRCLAQVDCQHRLGELGGVDLPLAFMIYLGLDLRQEMAIFNVINSKAKGLSSSLTDYHESKLLSDLTKDAPHLFISRRLNEDPASPWYQLIRYGGETTSGLKRRTSFRMMQKTVQTFLAQTRTILDISIEGKYQVVLCFWKAVQTIFSDAWKDHRSNLITKGVGLYALMQLLGDIVKSNPKADFSIDYFMSMLLPLKSSIDWSSQGRFAYVGGKKGAQDVYQALKNEVSL